jgi:branched-subunit amino acid aminotransferase/4-amino-4-deoxychorismate lyase
MFLTSTGREVVPIARVDGKPVGNGRPGPIARRLLEAYRAAVPSLLEED